MQHGDGSLIEHHPKSTKEPLSDDCKQQPQACPSIPLSRFGGPSSDVQPNCQETNPRAEQTMAMLDQQVEWAVEPSGNWVEKQVVPIGSRPIWDCHAGIMCSY